VQRKGKPTFVNKVWIKNNICKVLLQENLHHIIIVWLMTGISTINIIIIPTCSFKNKPPPRHQNLWQHHTQSYTGRIDFWTKYPKPLFQHCIHGSFNFHLMKLTL
jgi:hypothetical protein